LAMRYSHGQGSVRAFGNTFHNQGSCVTTPNQIKVEEAVPNGASLVCILTRMSICHQSQIAVGSILRLLAPLSLSGGDTMASVIACLEFWFYGSAPCNSSIKILKGMIVGTGVTQHPQTHSSDFVVIQLEEPQLRNPGTLLEPWAMRRLYGEQEPNEKSVMSMHHPSMVVCLWVLVYSGWLWVGGNNVGDLSEMVCCNIFA
jgi:hypothetical protein